MVRKRTVAVNIADEMGKIKEAEARNQPYTPNFTGTDILMTPEEEMARNAEEEAEAAKPVVKRSVNMGDIWAVLKAKSLVADADLPDDVEPPKNIGA